MNEIMLLIVYPLVVAFSLMLINRYLPKFYKLFVIGSDIVICLLSFNLLKKVLIEPVIYSLGSWEVTKGINLVADPLAGVFVVLIGVISLLINLYSLDYIEQDQSKYYSLFFLLLAGLNGMILTGDLFNLYVFLEIVSLVSYALVAFKRTKKAYEASFKYLIFGTLGSFFILLAIIIVYQQTGSLNLAELIVNAQSMSNLLRTTTLILLLIGFGSKFALVPLHTWLADAHPAAPASISALLSGVVIKVYLYAWLRTVLLLFDPLEMINLNFNLIIIYLGVLTLFVGHLLASQQQSLKRLLAYSSISQIGYIMIGIGLFNQAGIVGGLFHVINHAVVKASLFLTAGVFSKKTKTMTISDLKGVGYQTPLLALMFSISALTIVGLPPFNIFISKWLITKSAIEAGFLIPGLSILIGSILALSYYLKVIQVLYTKEDSKYNLLVTNWKIKLPITTLTLTCLLIGIMPDFILKELNQAVVYLLNSNDYYQIFFTG
ncbi:MAG: complex I subunit 5 family protein [Bacillota bacterium]